MSCNVFTKPNNVLRLGPHMIGFDLLGNELPQEMISYVDVARDRTDMCECVGRFAPIITFPRNQRGLCLRFYLGLKAGSEYAGCTFLLSRRLSSLPI